MVLMDLLDYETLRLVWWVLLGVLLVAFAVMDGFDLGVGMLLPFLGKSDGERRVIINTVGPVWEGNQVWLILGGGAIFAAWPFIYAVAFSGFYPAMFLALAALILRPVGFKFRSKMPGTRWRGAWDWLLFLGGLVPALIFGVAVGNALAGAPFKFDDSLRITYAGNLFDLLTPFPLLAGLVSLAMLAMHGSSYLAAKADEPVASRARRTGVRAAFVFILLFALAGLWAAYGLPGYRITSALDHGADSDPLGKTVVQSVGAWIGNYRDFPPALAAPAAGFLGALLAALALTLRRDGLAWVASALSVAGVVSTAGISMFPFILPSSLDPASSLTVWDASSSRATLFNMLVAALIFVPVIMAYTAFVYRVLRGRVTESQISSEHSSY